MPCQHCCRLDDSTLNVSMYTSYRKIWSDTVISSIIKLVSQSTYFWWIFKSVLDIKPLAHTTGLRPLRYLLCTTRVEHWVKAFPHSSHVNGFSPVWVRWCMRKLQSPLKALPHTSQTTGLSPLCKWQWDFSEPILDTDLPQMSQRKTFHPVWDATWRSKDFLYANVFPQVSHWFRFTSYCKSGWCMRLCSAKLFLYS